MALSADELRRLARLGAVARLQQLRQEEAAIRAEFPELFGRGRRSDSAAGQNDGGDGRARRGAAARPRRRMSAAARKAAAERMRRYWAERRKAKAAR
jgi:hypothetical protein